jgi:DNA-binding CsgD family transcriptional regulator
MKPSKATTARSQPDADQSGPAPSADCSGSPPAVGAKDAAPASPAGLSSAAAQDDLYQLCSEFALEDDVCRIVRIRPPARNGKHESAINGAASGRLEGEVARFGLGGQRYALLMTMSLRTRRILHAEDAAAARTNLERLLTERERQVAEQLCIGRTMKQTAEDLGLSELTVQSHLKAIYCKLGVRSRGAMVYRYAQALARLQANGKRGTA